MTLFEKALKIFTESYKKLLLKFKGLSLLIEMLNEFLPVLIFPPFYLLAEKHYPPWNKLQDIHNQ